MALTEERMARHLRALEGAKRKPSDQVSNMTLPHFAFRPPKPQRPDRVRRFLQPDNASDQPFLRLPRTPNRPPSPSVNGDLESMTGCRFDRRGAKVSCLVSELPGTPRGPLPSEAGRSGVSANSMKSTMTTTYRDHFANPYQNTLCSTTKATAGKTNCQEDDKASLCSASTRTSLLSSVAPTGRIAPRRRHRSQYQASSTATPLTRRKSVEFSSTCNFDPSGRHYPKEVYPQDTPH
eukprot:Sspe_Gene.102075::Locus_76821_Transcript_1_1_Confidence_1.000_Length_816::g.102075::m.102075